ncbi:MAG: GGDEF domain-containing protein, partial [Thermoleophilaceae bacterium]
ALRGGRESSAGDVARDVAALQAVLVCALREELAEREPERFAEAVERLVDATGAIQAAAAEELIRRRSRELESQANTDALTGLSNLRHLQRQIAHMLEVHRRYGHPFGVLLMDIDGLKRINDAHGHQAGDRVLMQVAMALQRSIRRVDVAARLGGDEFCVLAPEQEPEAAITLAQRLATAVREGVASPDDPPVALSIGVVSCPSHGNDAETLIDTADRAMYRAKATGDSVALGEPPAGELAEEAKS